MAKEGFLMDNAGGKSSMKTTKASKGGKITSKGMDTMPKPGSHPIKVKGATSKPKLSGVKSKSAKGQYK